MSYEYKGHRLGELRPKCPILDKEAVLRFLDYPNYWGAAARQQFLGLSDEDTLWVLDKLVARAARSTERSAGQQEHDVVMNAIMETHGQ